MEELDRPTVTNKQGFLTTQPSCDWARLVERIAAGDEDACAELYSRLRRIRYFFARRLHPQEAEDRYHDVILAVIKGIRQGAVRDPERLVGYAQAIAQHALTARIDALSKERKHFTEEDGGIITDPAPDPESLALRREKEEIATRILLAMPERDREVLIRFYLDGHSAECIQEEMDINATQFRLIKSRAKARFASLVKSRLALRSVAHDVPSMTA